MMEVCVWVNISVCFVGRVYSSKPLDTGTLLVPLQEDVQGGTRQRFQGKALKSAIIVCSSPFTFEACVSLVCSSLE